MLRIVFVALLACGIGGGCSFVAMRTPSGPGPPQCDDGYVYPAIDTVVAIAAPFLLYRALYDSSSATTPDGKQLDAFIGSFLLSIPVVGAYGTSAIYGFVKRDRCERAKRDYVQLVTPPPYLMPAPPPGPGGGVPAPVPAGGPPQTMPGPAGGPP